MSQVKYSPVYDELEIIFKESSVTSIHETSNGIILEFDGDELARIIAPYFSQSIPMPITEHTNFTYERVDFSDPIMIVVVKVDTLIINIKVDFS